MHSGSVENGMVIGAQDELDRRAANVEREARAYQLFLQEFLDAVRDGPDTLISYCHSRAPLEDVVTDLLDGVLAMREFVKLLRSGDLVRLHLADMYATQQLARYIEVGGL